MIRVRRRSLAPGQRMKLRGARARSLRILGPLRWPRVLALLLAAAVLLTALAAAVSATANVVAKLIPTEADLGPVPDPVGPRINAGLDVCLIIDDSGSTARTDPGATRYEAARFLTEFLAEQAQPGFDDRVCVVHFGDTAPASLALALTPASDRATISRALQLVPSQGGTNFVAANNRAAELVAASDQSRHQILIIFTDGQPSVGTSDDAFAAISRSLDGLPRWDTHLIALDGGGQYDDVRDQWERLGLGSTRRLSQLEGRHLEHAFAEIIVDELGMEWGA